MSSIKEKFSKRILEINGVKRYILVRDDGEILVHNLQEENPETISSILLFSGLNCNKIRSGFGFRNLKYLSVSKENNENLFIFPMEKYFLGVMQHSNANSMELLKDLSNFIEGIMMTKSNIR